MIQPEAIDAAITALGERYGEDAYCKEREYVIAILEAAAPYMLKSAYDLGFQHGSNEPANPYRSTK